LFGGFDYVGAHPFAIDSRDLGEARQDRLQLRCAHFDRLLHHVVEPCVFQRREHIGDVGKTVLQPPLGQDIEAVGPLAACNPGLPLAVAPVEHQHGFAGGKPQHVAEIIALVSLKRDRLARAQGGVDEQAGAAKIEFRHL